MSRSPVRLLGLDNEHIADFRTQDSRNSGLYRALDERLHVVATATPALPVARLRAIQALHLAPGRVRWRRRSALSPMSFRALSAAAGREVAAHAGDYDVLLQLYCLFAPGSSPPARPYALYLDATLALTRREYPPSAPITARAERRWMALERHVYHGAGRLFAMSDWVRDSLVGDYEVPSDRVVVVGAGANLVAGDLPARDGAPVALFVGLDWERKGGEVLLEAWPAVRAALPAAELWIAGPPPRVERGDGVRWHGRLDRDGLGALYAQASVFALPSLFDPFPHVLREAMGYGLPCVATRTGAVAEIIAEGRDSLVVPPGKPAALADALIAVLGDPVRAEAMGRSGYTRTRSGVTWDAVADRMAPHLLTLAGDDR